MLGVRRFTDVVSEGSTNVVMGLIMQAFVPFMPHPAKCSFNNTLQAHKLNEGVASWSKGLTTSLCEVPLFYFRHNNWIVPGLSPSHHCFRHGRAAQWALLLFCTYASTWLYVLVAFRGDDRYTHGRCIFVSALERLNRAIKCALLLWPITLRCRAKIVNGGFVLIDFCGHSRLVELIRDHSSASSVHKA